jgi:hypothetical protein
MLLAALQTIAARFAASEVKCRPFRSLWIYDHLVTIAYFRVLSLCSLYKKRGSGA